MLFKALKIVLLICIIGSLIWAVSGKIYDDGSAVLFSSTFLLEVLRDSPKLETDWILELNKAKLDVNIEKQIYNFIASLFEFAQTDSVLSPSGGGIGGGGGGARGDTVSLGFISTLWNLQIDAVAAFFWLGTAVAQVFVYAFYFLQYFIV